MSNPVARLRHEYVAQFNLRPWLKSGIRFQSLSTAFSITPPVKGVKRRIAAQQIVMGAVWYSSHPAHQIDFPDDPDGTRVQREYGSFNIVKNGHSASSSQQHTARTAEGVKCLVPKPRGYSEEEKEKILRAYIERGSRRAVSRIFGINRNPLNRWFKKRQLKRDVGSTRWPRSSGLPEKMTSLNLMNVGPTSVSVQTTAFKQTMAVEAYCRGGGGS